jgi:hypothetical protein
MELVDVVGELGIFKTRWLLHIDQFLDWPIEECTLDIHLVQLEVMMGSKG